MSIKWGLFFHYGGLGTLVVWSAFSLVKLLRLWLITCKLTDGRGGRMMTQGGWCKESLQLSQRHLYCNTGRYIPHMYELWFLK